MSTAFARPGAGAVLDANLLVLLILGDVAPEALSTFEHTRNFGPDDYDKLSFVVGKLRPLVTTPNILTEVSNLANRLKYERRDRFFARFAELVPALDERFVPTNTIAGHPLLSKFGVTDLGLFHLVGTQMLAVTADNRLADYLGRQRVQVLSMDQIRALV